ncbi:MAG: hypothetical protein E7213_04240 [Clostridium sp.]|nr:hypothetical protein [Clostridium sp.]
MQRQEALKLIEQEELNKYRRFSFTGENLTENMTAVRKTNDGYECIDVDERGGVEVVDTFDNEEEAIDKLIEGLRVFKRFAERRNRRRR